MRITWDKSVNAAYVYLVDMVERQGVANTVELEPRDDRHGTLYVDFDASGRVMGIEVLVASERLPRELLDQAEIIG